MENDTILGISLGTRHCGIAVMKNGILYDWRVKNYTTRWSENKLDRIIASIEKLIDRNGVKKIGCKIPLHMRTYRIDSILAKLQALADIKEIQLCVTSIDELKMYWLHPKIENKETYAEHLCDTYPELTPMLQKHRKAKTEYYLRIFEAVGAAMHCQAIENID